MINECMQYRNHIKKSQLIALCMLMFLSVVSCASPLGNNAPTSTPKVVVTPIGSAVQNQAASGFTQLFNGKDMHNWRMSTAQAASGSSDPGHFVVVNGTLEALAGNTLGLLWCTDPTPPDYLLKVEWMTSRVSDNSGVFIRFPQPDSKGYANTAWVGVDYGFEVQIDQRGEPDGAPKHKTGAIYNLAGPKDANHLPLHPPGQWNAFEIRVQGQHYTISLNGVLITSFTFVVGSDRSHPDRGLPTSPASPRFIGLQTHPGSSPIFFRHIQIQGL